jgi:predicted RecB family nuclease
MPMPITAAMLYDLVECPHRVTMDLFGDPADRDPISPFVQLLWERGSLYEKEVIAGLKLPFTDLSRYAEDEKERETYAAMKRGDPLIYGGRIRADDLLGTPDLLRRENGGYIAGDIKSGAGEEGEEDREDKKPKKHYAVQLALYTDILRRLGLSAGPSAFIWDVHGREMPYSFTAVHGKHNPRTLWQDYEEALTEARAILCRTSATLPAYIASKCRNCVWHTACLKSLQAADDLTLIPEFGRSRRDAMIGRIPTIAALAAADPKAFLQGKGETVFEKVDPKTLEKFIARAKLVKTQGAAYLRTPVRLPAADKELFFDIEVDPMRDICYLHGFIERRGGDNKTERFIAFLADEPTIEKEARAFDEAWRFIKAAMPAAIYFYSKYERMMYRKLRAKYPHVCSETEIEELFARPTTVDLYGDVVEKATEWPTRDYSLKTLAKHLGFDWRDAHPSGSASIEWFDRWVKTGDESVKQRILDYNEDDCRATRWLLDGIRALH